MHSSKRTNGQIVQITSEVTAEVLLFLLAHKVKSQLQHLSFAQYQLDCFHYNILQKVPIVPQKVLK